VLLRGLAVLPGRTTVLGCTAQVLFEVAVGVGGEPLVQRSGPIMDLRRGVRGARSMFSLANRTCSTPELRTSLSWVPISRRRFANSAISSPSSSAR